jgi:hypothetical protein
MRHALPPGFIQTPFTYTHWGGLDETLARRLPDHAA